MEDPAVTPIPPANTNGLNKRRISAIGVLLGLVVVVRAIIAGLSFFRHPDQWDLVNGVSNDLNIMAIALMGGLLGITKPSGS
jgi:hypothetical protein